MISKEQAQEGLKSFRKQGETEKQIARLRKLPAKVSKIGQVLIQAGPEWEKIQKEQNSPFRFRQPSQEQVGELNSKGRQALFAALFPGTAALVEETWNLFDRLPYQTGYVRRPFRAPNQKFAAAKSSWLNQYAALYKRISTPGCHLVCHVGCSYLGIFGPANIRVFVCRCDR